MTSRLATFLVGYVAAALIGLIPDQKCMWSWHGLIVCFTILSLTFKSIIDDQ